MRRRVFLSGALLTGVGLPLLAGCKLPWQSKGQAASASASASAGGSAAVPGASGAPQGWQELDAHVMGHHLGFQVSPLVRRDEKTTVLVLKLTRAKDDPAVKDIADDPGDGSNTFEASIPLTRPGLSDSLLLLPLALFSTPVVATHTRLAARSSRRTPPAAGSKAGLLPGRAKE